MGTVNIPAELASFVKSYRDGDLDWMDEALCAQVDPELFYPEKGGSTKEAKQVCLACPVRAECLAHALDTDERYGVLGGLSERERRTLKHRSVTPLTLPHGGSLPEPKGETWPTSKAATYMQITSEVALKRLQRAGLLSVGQAGTNELRWYANQVRAYTMRRAS